MQASTVELAMHHPMRRRRPLRAFGRGGSVRGVDRMRVDFKTSMDPRVRAWMDNRRGKIVWFRLALDSRRHPEVRSTVVLAPSEGAVVPGAGLFVALGTSTHNALARVDGEANVRQTCLLSVARTFVHVHQYIQCMHDAHALDARSLFSFLSGYAYLVQVCTTPSQDRVVCAGAKASA